MYTLILTYDFESIFTGAPIQDEANQAILGMN
jgi:hypothetical protein